MAPLFRYLRGVFPTKRGGYPPFCSLWRKGKRMECCLCHEKAEALVRVTYYSHQGAFICPACRDKVEAKRYQPYSKVMERLAVAETGYYANRKRARRTP